MDEASAEGGQPGPLGVTVRARHIKKRALKNKSLSISFNEKNLSDFVTGFHKRKKKRRREALHKQEEADRRKRVEQRKKRKLERDFVICGGALPDSGMVAAESEGEHEDGSEDSEPIASVSGTMMYDNEDVQVTVTTSEITRQESYPVDRSEVGKTQSVEAFENSMQRTPASSKKQPKKAPRKRSLAKPQSKRAKKKGNKKNKKH